MSSLKFGTSGLRGLVADLVDGPAADWVGAFLRHLEASRLAPAAREVIVGRDLRSSSPALARDCLAASAALGWRALDAGALPTPALAQEALRRAAAAVMVTGSHIPDDRNGLKFYRPDGEITKADEAGIRAAFDTGGELPAEARTAGSIAPLGGLAEAYVARIVGFFGTQALSGLRIGVYQQSSVARDILVEALQRLGATAEPLGRAAGFIPVDTEAHRAEDLDLLTRWTSDGRFDAVVSTDGDADRPLVADETGRVVRGDLLGLLTARQLGAGIVVTPVTSTSGLERAPFLTKVVRTRVGSPFVIEGMEAEAGRGIVVGFEANGGVLLGSDVSRGGRRLPALKTRDALLPIVAALVEAKAAGLRVSALVADLRAGAAAADRLPEIASDRSGPFLAMLASGGAGWRSFFAPRGEAVDVDAFDGVRTTLRDGSTVHFRASGNAPELRCYVEAPGEEEASDLLAWGLAAARGALGG